MMALAPRPASPGPGNGQAATQPKNQFAPEDEAPLLLDASALLRVFAAGVRLAVAQLATLPLRLRHGTPISGLGLAARPGFPFPAKVPLTVFVRQLLAPPLGGETSPY